MPKTNEIITLPALAMRGLVIFPGMVLHFDVGRDKSVKALKSATSTDRKVFLVTQKDSANTDPKISDIYKVGVVAEVRQILRTPDGNTRVLVEGLYRAKINAINDAGEYLTADVCKLNVREAAMSESENDAFVRLLLSAFKDYCALAPKMPNELYDNVLSEKSAARLFDLIVFNIYLKVEDRQKLLEIPSTRKRIEELITCLANETKIIKLEMDIHEQVKNAIEKNQHEYYLREQMRVISQQLGNNDDPEAEYYDYIDKIEECGFDDDVLEKLSREAEKLIKLSPNSPEYGVIKNYLDSILEMPWNTYTHDRINLNKAQSYLDKDHFGLKKVKERILENIAVRALNPEVKGQIICLVGPPGVGKTSIGRSIAEAIGRNYVRVSLGGVRDEAEIRGHRKTYIGSMPGRIIDALKQAKSMNPLILFDEIDKMGADYKGDPSSAMLEVLDPEQNIGFVDHYFEIPVDLSKVLFITTANTTDTIPTPLLDRMEIIELGSYTREEKFNIAKKHLIPKQLKKHGESASVLKINDKALYDIIDGYTREAGVRKLEQRIGKICRKAAKMLVEGEKKVTVTPKNLHDFLGIKRFLPEMLPKQDEVGCVNGLAWTSVGGVLMPLEVIVLDGAGKTEITGSLGDVMTESARIAISLVRSIADKYNIDPNFYKDKDIHIHAPEGAVPKDGPSAGVTMTTALVSALSGIAVRREVAMTGEITLHGKVLPIGGLKEKTMAAYRAGVKTVIVPFENKPDLEEIDDVVKENVDFVIAENIDDVLSTALVKTNITPISPKRNTKKAEILPAETIPPAKVDLV